MAFWLVTVKVLNIYDNFISLTWKMKYNISSEWYKIIVTVQYLHSYEPKCIKNHLRWWHFGLYVSGFWYLRAKTPRGIVDYWIVTFILHFHVISDVTEDSIQQNPVFSNINLSDIQTKIRNNKLLIVFLLSAYIVRERCALCLCMINLYAHLSHLSLIRFSGSPELCISWFLPASLLLLHRLYAHR